MNLHTALKSRLETDTGYPVYALEKPVEKSVPATVYRIIADMPFLSVSDEDTALRTARVQITSIAANYADLQILVRNTEDFLYGNTDYFKTSIPLATKIEDKEDNLYYSIREYTIWYDINE